MCCRVYHCLSGNGACCVTGQDLLPFVWGGVLCLPVCDALLPHSSSRLCELTLTSQIVPNVPLIAAHKGLNLIMGTDICVGCNLLVA